MKYVFPKQAAKNLRDDFVLITASLSNFLAQMILCLKYR